MKKRIKILIVGPDRNMKGGVAHHIRTLLASPLNEDFHLSYFKIGSNPDNGQLKIVVKFLLTPFRFLLQLWIFWPDVVHFNPSFDTRSIIRELNMVLICKVFNRTNLLQFHGGNLANFINTGQIPFYLKLIIKLTSHLAVLTNIQK